MTPLQQDFHMVLFIKCAIVTFAWGWTFKWNISHGTILLTRAEFYKRNLPHFFRNRPWPLLAEPESGLTLVTFNADIMNYRQASWIWVRKYYGNSVHKYLIRPSLLTVKQHQYTHLIWRYLKDMPADLCWTTLLKKTTSVRIVDSDEKVENSCPEISYQS